MVSVSALLFFFFFVAKVSLADRGNYSHKAFVCRVHWWAEEDPFPASCREVIAKLRKRICSYVLASNIWYWFWLHMALSTIRYIGKRSLSVSFIVRENMWSRGRSVMKRFSNVALFMMLINNPSFVCYKVTALVFITTRFANMICFATTPLRSFCGTSNFK